MRALGKALADQVGAAQGEDRDRPRAAAVIVEGRQGILREVGPGLPRQGPRGEDHRSDPALGHEPADRHRIEGMPRRLQLRDQARIGRRDARAPPATDATARARRRRPRTSSPRGRPAGRPDRGSRPPRDANRPISATRAEEVRQEAVVEEDRHHVARASAGKELQPLGPDPLPRETREPVALPAGGLQPVRGRAARPHNRRESGRSAGCAGNPRGCALPRRR